VAALPVWNSGNVRAGQPRLQAGTQVRSQPVVRISAASEQAAGDTKDSDGHEARGTKSQMSALTSYNPIVILKIAPMQNLSRVGVSLNRVISASVTPTILHLIVGIKAAGCPAFALRRPLVGFRVGRLFGEPARALIADNEVLMTLKYRDFLYRGGIPDTGGLVI
jgi:hypothetical protein